MYQKAYYKKREYKKQLKNKEKQNDQDKLNYEKEIEYLRSKISWEKTNIATQTDTDIIKYNKMEKNNDLVIYQKRLTQNKLNQFIDRIKYQCTKNKPISKKSLLNLIPELYNEKNDYDFKLDLEGGKRTQFDGFFFDFMNDKFKIKKIVKKNCEETIMAVMKYSAEDSRIDIFRRFLGIGDDKIRREIFDKYITIIKSLPISFYKLFVDDYNTYLMNAELCFEIYHNKFPSYDLMKENKDTLIKFTKVFEGDEEIKLKVKNKLDYFLLSRFYNKSYVIINDMFISFKANKDVDISMEEIAEHFENANKEFKFSRKDTILLFENCFKVKNNKIRMENFFEFFVNKYSFKIKIIDFLETTVNRLLIMYQLIEKRVTKVYDIYDIRKQGIIQIKEFEEILPKLITNLDSKWQVNDFFK